MSKYLIQEKPAASKCFPICSALLALAHILKLLPWSSGLCPAMMDWPAPRAHSNSRQRLEEGSEHVGQWEPGK